MESLDLKTITRFEGVKNVPSGVVVSALATPGRQYAAYMFHGGDDKEWGAHFVGVPGQYRDQITLAAVPAGHYRLEWIDPISGAGDAIRHGERERRRSRRQHTLVHARHRRCA